jgi:type IV pilus assembly protein PilM
MFDVQGVGLDIADHTIEVAVLRKSLFAQRPSIKARARIALEQGVVERGRIMNRKKLDEALTLLWESLGEIPRRVVFGLPEHQVYTTVVHIEESNPSLQTIKDICIKTIPLEKDDLSCSYSLLSRTPRGSDILVYGTSVEIMNEWHDFFESISLEVHAYDHELLAIFRGLFGGAAITRPLCVADLGAERTKIAIFGRNGLEYVHAIDVAGDVFTSELSKQLELPPDQAEKIKREQGMEPTHIYPLFCQLLQPVLNEIKTALAYSKQKNDEQVDTIILVGGSSRLKGLLAYMHEQIGIPVAQGSSFLLKESSSPEGSDTLHYIEAIGLALKDIDPAWEKRHPSLK